MNTFTKSHAWPALNIYRAGAFGYAYNPSSRRWEVYALNDAGEIADLLGDHHSKDAAWSDATSRNAREASKS